VPAVVGAVLPDSPAARAGLKAGDEVIEIAGESNNLDFSNIMLAAALSDVNEAVSLKVRHEDGSVEDFAIVAEQMAGEQMRVFGDKFGRVRCWGMGLFFLVVFSSLLSADEVDKLIEEAGAPASFAIHTGDFSAKEEEFTFDSNEGQIERSLWVIKDRDRYVAIWHEEASKLYVVAANPARASKEIKMPSAYDAGGDTFDGKLGVRVTTFPYCYGPIQTADKRRFNFSGGWGKLTLTDTSTWIKEHNTEAVYTLTFGCDPVLGYVLDIDVEFKTNDEEDENGNPFEPELVNLYPSNTSMQKMPEAGWRYEYTVYTPPNSDKYIGWINDIPHSVICFTVLSITAARLAYVYPYFPAFAPSKRWKVPVMRP